MKKDPFKSFFDPLKSQKLSDAERQRSRKELAQFMQENPVRKPADERHSERTGFIGSLLFLTQFPMRLRFVSITAVVLVLALGSITVAAANSLPGDSLYPVKVEFNEEVVSLFTFSDEDELEWEMERAENRIEELEELEESGELTEENEAEGEAYFEEHMVEIEALVDEIVDAENQEELEAAVADLTEALAVLSDDEEEDEEGEDENDEDEEGDDDQGEDEENGDEDGDEDEGDDKDGEDGDDDQGEDEANGDEDGDEGDDENDDEDGDNERGDDAEGDVEGDESDDDEDGNGEGDDSDGDDSGDDKDRE